MGSRQLQPTDPNTRGKPDVVNLGRVRPPMVYSSSITDGALLTWLWRLPFALPTVVPIGGAMVFASNIRKIKHEGGKEGDPHRATDADR
jgi:hypothetical protein